MEENNYNVNEDIFSKVLRAGRRTYFFDVRSTKAGDYYLTISESKKFTNEDGTFYFKKHKIYLYKEDFESNPLQPNEFVMLVSSSNEKKTAIGRFDDWHKPILHLIHVNQIV